MPCQLSNPACQCKGVVLFICTLVVLVRVFCAHSARLGSFALTALAWVFTQGRSLCSRRGFLPKAGVFAQGGGLCPRRGFFTQGGGLCARRGFLLKAGVFAQGRGSLPKAGVFVQGGVFELSELKRGL
ncbi:hypothetical protein L211DRAFT_196170 [Terfezia boudieri ATCC MYA-4762]|uniref:Uncharacterized protein n=1 Tax=Terfezia boudieri ATCC MYA-4762 TaxID=1051890 RepID=A0A3N4M267_9PEZI|nr:hypothetical protein L211DRAFT_196170 [Terfezia boudieri ATCC MYA-4762]